MKGYGADPDQLDDLSSTFRAVGERLRRNQEVISSLVENNRWSGPAAAAFLDTWRSKSSPRLRAASDVLTELATTLRRQATDQRTASAAGTWGAGAASASLAGGVAGGGAAASLAGGGTGSGDTQGGDGPAGAGAAAGGTAITGSAGAAYLSGSAETGGGGGGSIGGDPIGEGGLDPLSASNADDTVGTPAIVGWDGADPAFAGWAPPPMPDDGWAAMSPAPGDGEAGLGEPLGQEGAVGIQGGSAAGMGDGALPEALGPPAAAEPVAAGQPIAAVAPAESGPAEVLASIGSQAMNPRFLVGGLLGGAAMLARQALTSRDRDEEYLGDGMVERTGIESLGWRPGIGREHSLRLGGVSASDVLPRSASHFGARLGLPDRGS